MVSISSYSCDNTAGVHLSDAMVINICDIYISGVVYCYRRRIIKTCIRGKAAVDADSSISCSSYSGDNPIGINLSDAVMIVISDIYDLNRTMN